AAIEMFFITNYLFSLLTDNDKKDAARLTNDYFKGNLAEPVNDILTFVEDCRRKNPEKFSLDNPLNQSRTQFLNEIAHSDQIFPEHHFYTITAPTGIGKTYGCLAFANSLKKKLSPGSGRIIYCLPYTSIIDQNYTEFEKIIQFNKGSAYSARPSRYLLKHHYLTEKEIVNRVDSENRSYKDYLDDQLLVESWQSAMIVTTFVQFFHTIIGNKNRMLKKFHSIVNSIVILDEVQNVDPDYYRLICECFKILGERFNIYFLLITATQPNILDKRTTVSLVDSAKYMTAALFNRVKLSINTKEKDQDTFLAEFRDNFNGDNCLLVMNTKRMAIECYQFIEKQYKEYHKYCLTTNLTPYDRELIIDEIKSRLSNQEKVIVVSTQLIEAGVDVSFETVYRDFGPFDSIVQVAGRCNRNGEYGVLGGKMLLVNLGNYRVYKHFSYQKECINNIINEEEYESKDFYNLSEQYFGRLNFEAKAEKFLSAISELNYDVRREDQTPVSDFTLIEEQPKTDIFILRTEDSQRNMDRLIELLACLKERDLLKEEKDNILIEFEKLKNALKKFQISIYQQEFQKYQAIIKSATPGSDLYQYISYENHLKYAYDEKVGFLKEPKASLPGAMFY
ncbi:CRISPR-associated helicase Cas3', partial [bacterium]|nr:CRISPR-associated helicase Cas3' [bacterium]